MHIFAAIYIDTPSSHIHGSVADANKSISV